MYPVTILLSCIAIGEVLGDCPHSQFIQNSICDDCRGWKEVRNIVRFFSPHLVFSYSFPMQRLLYSSPLFFTFLSHTLYFPIAGFLHSYPRSFIFSPMFFILLPMFFSTIQDSLLCYLTHIIYLFQVLFIQIYCSLSSFPTFF